MVWPVECGYSNGNLSCDGSSRWADPGDIYRYTNESFAPNQVRNYRFWGTLNCPYRAGESQSSVCRQSKKWPNVMEGYKVELFSRDGAALGSYPPTPRAMEHCDCKEIRPVNLKAVVEGPNQVKLTWLDRSDEEYFSVQRKFSKNGSYVTVADHLPEHTESFIDTNFADTGYYSYQVTAEHSALQVFPCPSDVSNEVPIDPPEEENHFPTCTITQPLPSQNVVPGTQLPVRISLNDADGDALSYVITAQGGALLGAPRGTASAPAEISRTFSLVNAGGAAASIIVDVADVAHAAARCSVRLGTVTQGSIAVTAYITDESCKQGSDKAENVNVWVKQGSRTLFEDRTDARGESTFDSLGRGSYTLLARKSGYSVCRQNQTVTISDATPQQSVRFDLVELTAQGAFFLNQWNFTTLSGFEKVFPKDEPMFLDQGSLFVDGSTSLGEEGKLGDQVYHFEKYDNSRSMNFSKIFALPNGVRDDVEVVEGENLSLDTFLKADGTLKSGADVLVVKSNLTVPPKVGVIKASLIVEGNIVLETDTEKEVDLPLQIQGEIYGNGTFLNNRRSKVTITSYLSILENKMLRSLVDPRTYWVQ